MKKPAKNLLSLFLLSFVFSFTSCGEKESPADLSRKEMIASQSTKTWYQVGEEFGGQKYTFKDCAKDNTYTFSANQDFVMDEGPMVCDSDTLDFEGRWRLSEDLDSIIISTDTIFGFSALVIKAYISKLDVDNMHLYVDDSLFQGTYIYEAAD